MNGSSLASVFLVLGSAASFLLVPFGEVRAVYDGPTVQVSTMTEMVEAGSETEITVTCSNNDGGSLDLMSVSISATLGSCSPNEAISDQNGDCHFTYHAPSNVPGPTSITITAVMENGLFDVSASKDLIVSYHISGEIIGPNLVRVGSPDVTCMVQVTAGDRPLSGANLNPTVLGSGSYVSHSSTTNSSGDALLVVSPSAVATGQINIMVQVNKVGYISTTLSKGITVSQTLDPLVLTVTSDRTTCKRWGSCLFTATVTRGGTPEPGVSLSWRSDKGTMYPASTTTASNGTSTSYFTATGFSDGAGGGSAYEAVIINVTATNNAETVHRDEGIVIERENAVIRPTFGSPDGTHPTKVDTYYLYIPNILDRSQYFPGEDMVLNVFAKGGSWLDLVHRVRSWFVLTDPIGREVCRVDIGTGCSQDSRIFSFGPSTVHTVTDVPMVGNYSCKVEMTDPLRVHIYYVYESQDRVRILRDGKDDWTFMYYFAGDNNLADWMDREIAALEAANPHGKFKVYVLYDRAEFYEDDSDGSVEWTGTKRFDLDRGLSDAEDYPEPINSGDGFELFKFMTWAADCSPAGHYCLVLSDHGAAQEGVCFQDRSIPWRNIDLNDLNGTLSGFSSAKRMTDVLVYDACNMASLEVAAHAREHTRYQVFSQKVMWTQHGFDSPQVLDRLRNGHDWSTSGPLPLEVATDFIEGFDDVAGGTIYDCPVAVVDSLMVDELIVALESLCRPIYYNWDLLGDCMVQAFEEMWRTDGPYAEQTNLADLKGFIALVREGLSEYIMTVPGRAAYEAAGEFMSSFDDTIEAFLPMGDYNGLNIFLPVNRNTLQYSDRFVDLGSEADHWFKCLKAIHTGSGGVLQSGGIQPLRPGTPFVIDGDSDGASDGFGFSIGSDDFSYGPGWFMVATMSRLITTGGGGLLNGSLGDMRVFPLEGVHRNLSVNLTAPSNGSYIVHIRVVDPQGQVVQESLVGNVTLEGSPSGGNAPILEVAAPSEVSVGEELSFVANASDIEGVHVDVWWDMDTRNGLGLDGVGHDMNWSYRLSGNTSMVCFASDGSHITVKEIPIVVIPVQGNNAPSANLSIFKNGLAVQLLAANPMNTSLDPDGDRLQYRFNFGDGNMTGWVDDPGILHVYPRSGIFTVSLKVRDHRGGESERYFLDLKLFKVPNSAPLFYISGSTNLEIEDWSPMTPLYLNPIIVDRDGDPITINISWGDGCSETYGYPPEEDVRYNHTYADYGTYIITVTASDDEGNEDSLNYTLHLLKDDEGRTDQDLPIFLIMIAMVALVTLLLIIVLVLVLISKARYRVDEE